MTETTETGEGRMAGGVPAAAVSGEGLAARRAQRNARSRGIAFLVVALVALYFASS